MIRIVLTFVIVAVGGIVVAYFVTKIISAVMKLKDDYDKRNKF